MTNYKQAEIESEAAIYAQDTKFTGSELVQTWNSSQNEGERLQDFFERFLAENCVDMAKLADALGYEKIEWDCDNDCYSGYGSSDPTDRSRDDSGGFLVAADDEELESIAKREIGQ